MTLAPKPTVFDAERFVPFVFHRTDVAAGLTDDPFRFPGGTAGAAAIPFGFRGRVGCLTAFGNAAVTAQSITVEIFRNGADAGWADVVLDATADTVSTYYGTEAGYNAGDRIDLRITTPVGFTPTTLDLTCVLWVEVLR